MGLSVTVADWSIDSSEAVFALGDDGVVGSVCAEGAFHGLDADVGHRFGGGALEVAVAVGRGSLSLRRCRRPHH